MGCQRAAEYGRRGRPVGPAQLLSRLEHSPGEDKRSLWTVAMAPGCAPNASHLHQSPPSSRWATLASGGDDKIKPEGLD